jgi:Ankyrin repeats (3 copies)
MPSLLGRIIEILWESEEQRIFNSFMLIARNFNIKKKELEEQLKELNFLDNIEIIKNFCLKRDGGTPLHQAALYGNINLIKFLLSRKNNFKFSVNDIDNNRSTPLHNASICVIRNYSTLIKSKEKIWKVIEYLLEKEAKYWLRNSDEETPFNIVKSYDDEFLSKRYLEIIRLNKFKNDEITYREYVSKELEILNNNFEKLKNRVSKSSKFGKINFSRNTIASISSAMINNDHEEVYKEVMTNRREFINLAKT